MRDLHTEITDKIVDQISRGTMPWRKPWDSSANFSLPVNGTTNNQYHGINIALLWLANQENGFDSNEWASFNQWRDKKECVKKGAKGNLVIYYDKIERTKDDKVEYIPFIKSSYVFNRCQLQGYKPEVKEQRPLIERLEHVDRYILNTGAGIYHDGGARAYYSRATDDIHLPPRDSFKDKESLYSTTLHEVVHWTSAKPRCDRQLGKRFGDKEYAAEELVAELGAAFHCAGLEITNEPREDHASYIENWLDIAKGDKKAIFTAASEADKSIAFTNALQKCDKLSNVIV